ncbi:hypothetical protein OAO18_08160, partial [Francisellaceae bacterium]|nr:hypothetical protein [Francisellaceae bacterium]
MDRQIINYETNQIVVADKISISIITDLVENLDIGDLEKVKIKISDFVEETRICDIRCLLYYLFSSFAQKKLEESFEVAQYIEYMLSEGIEYLSPKKNKTTIIKKTIEWLVRYFPERFLEEKNTFLTSDLIIKFIESIINIVNLSNSDTPEVDKFKQFLCKEIKFIKLDQQDQEKLTTEKETETEIHLDKEESNLQEDTPEEIN